MNRLGLFFCFFCLCRLPSDFRTWNPPVLQETLPISDPDMAQDIGIDSQGNSYVTGYSYLDASNYDFITLKYDPQGQLLWESRLNGSANDADFAQCLVVCGDGGVIVAGHSSGIDSSLDATVVKYDASGRMLWSDRYDGPGGRDDYAYAAAVDSQGHVLVGGYCFGQNSEHDFLILKYTPLGKRLWTALYNPPRNRSDVVNALAVDARGYVTVTGVDRVQDTSYDFTTLNYCPDGKRNWLARYSGPGDALDSGQAVAVDPEGSVYATGFSDCGSREQTNIIAIKVGGDGQILWQTEYDGPAHLIDKPTALALDEKGRVYIAGISQGQDTAMDILLLAYSPEGKLLWETRYDGPVHGADKPHALAMDTRGCLVLAGYSRTEEGGRDALVIKCSPGGEILWAANHNGTGSGTDEAKAVAIDADGDIFVTGFSHEGSSGLDMLTLKYDASGRLLWKTGFSGTQAEIR